MDPFFAKVARWSVVALVVGGLFWPVLFFVQDDIVKDQLREARAALSEERVTRKNQVDVANAAIVGGAKAVAASGDTVLIETFRRLGYPIK